MNGIEKQAAFYRGYLPDDRSQVALTIGLATSVALWLIVYVVGAVSGVPKMKAPQSRPLRASSEIQEPRAR